MPEPTPLFSPSREFYFNRPGESSQTTSPQCFAMTFQFQWFTNVITRKLAVRRSRFKPVVELVISERRTPTNTDAGERGYDCGFYLCPIAYAVPRRSPIVDQHLTVTVCGEAAGWVKRVKPRFGGAARRSLECSNHSRAVRVARAAPQELESAPLVPPYRLSACPPHNP
jgi:hypothetical protein